MFQDSKSWESRWKVTKVVEAHLSVPQRLDQKCNNARLSRKICFDDEENRKMSCILFVGLHNTIVAILSTIHLNSTQPKEYFSPWSSLDLVTNFEELNYIYAIFVVLTTGTRKCLTSAKTFRSNSILTLSSKAYVQEKPSEKLFQKRPSDNFAP
jgi:hypothetical protein